MNKLLSQRKNIQETNRTEKLLAKMSTNGAKGVTILCEQYAIISNTGGKKRC